jgi:hypothetical protein
VGALGDAGVGHQKWGADREAEASSQGGATKTPVHRPTPRDVAIAAIFGSGNLHADQPILGEGSAKLVTDWTGSCHAITSTMDVEVQADT